MERQRAFSWITPLIFLGLWAVLVIRSGRWPAGDGPHVLGTAMRLAQDLRAGELSAAWEGLGTLVGPHPPGAYLLATAAFFGLGPTTAHAHLLAGALVLLLLWDGLRRLGAGAVTALFVAATPLVWLQAEAYGLDLLAAACVAQALGWLAQSRGLRDPVAAAAWGAWMGLGFLSKYTVPLFLWAPCLVAGVWALKGRRWRALLGAVLAFGLVAGPWFATHIGPVLGYLGASQGGAGAVLTNQQRLTESWWSAERLSWYPAALVDAWGWPGAVAAGLAMGLHLRRRGSPKGAWILPLSAVMGGWLLLTAQSQRQDRYLLPALPLVATLVGTVRGRWLLAPIGAIGAYGVAATFASTAAAPGSRDYSHDLGRAGQDWPWVAPAYRPVSLDPRPWRLDEGIAALRRWHGEDTGTVAFLLDERDGAPTFGLTLSRVAAAGLRWDVATVMVMERGNPPEAAVFVGPFAGQGWPSRDFRSLLAIVDPSDHRRERWLSASQMTLQERWELPHGREGRIYTWDGPGRVPGTPAPLH